MKLEKYIQNSNQSMLTWVERDYTATILSTSRQIQIPKISKDSFPRDLKFSDLLSKEEACVLFDIVV
jgi:hypothetical protein